MSHYTKSRVTQCTMKNNYDPTKCHIIQNVVKPNVPRKTTRSPPNVTLYKKPCHPMSHEKQLRAHPMSHYTKRRETQCSMKNNYEPTQCHIIQKAVSPNVP
jgi:hypothetical protein